MRKLFLTLSIVCLTVLGASAQLQKGSTLVGGGIGEMKFGLGKGSSFEMSLVPRVGYFIQDNVAIGAKVGLGFQKAGDVSSYNYSLNGFGRYYFGPKEFDTLLKQGRWFAEAGLGVSGIKNGSAGFNLNFGPGYSYFLSDNVAVEGLVLVDTKLGKGSTTGLIFNLGFQIYFPYSKYKNESKRF